MPFIPHTENDTKQMLNELRIKSLQDLFDEIPVELQTADFSELSDALTEMDLQRFMQERASLDKYSLSFIGAGAYEHHIPAAVWDIASRGEWMTSYTPYQAEASQGTLQLLYEYQTMMANLMDMPVSNASLYDGASALAEAVLMAARSHPHVSTGRVLLPLSLHPHYRQVVKTIVQAEGIEIVEVPFSDRKGCVQLSALTKYWEEEIIALVIPQPNFFGVLESADQLTDWTHLMGGLVIGVVNPISVGLLKPPGKWGFQGADIVCGEGQSLGVPLNSGGPYFGFLCCTSELIRQLPGRLVGRTVDEMGNKGFTLTLQAREQHIRRAKATSNICTNQGWMVTAATLYLSLLGAEGLRRVAAKSHANTRFLKEQLSLLSGVSLVFDSPFFHEIVMRFPIPVAGIIAKLATQGILAGLNLRDYYPEFGECLLISATETKSTEDLLNFVAALKTLIEAEGKA